MAVSPLDIELFFEGDPFFESLYRAIQQAKQSIEIEIYIFAGDELGRSLGDLLKQKVRDGVRVRILYDAIGCSNTSPFFFADLEEAGCELKMFHPIFQLGRELTRRNHRKFIVIDQKQAFLGGYNFTNEYSERYFGKKSWRDSGLRIDDAGVVLHLSQLFEAAWKGKKEAFVEYLKGRWKRPQWDISKYHIIPNFGQSRLSMIRQEYISAIIRSRKNLFLTHSYFVPDFGMVHALRKAARRGVDVKIIVAGESDVPFVRWASHATYTSLLSAGVRIYEYQGRVLHAKTGVSDSEWWTVGTSNIDHLSFFRNMEVNLVAHDAERAGVLEDQFREDLLSSEEITFERWKKRHWSQKVREQIFVLLRHWL